MDMSVALIHGDETATYPIAANRALWIHIASGSVTMNGHALKTGDGVAITEKGSLSLQKVIKQK